MKGSYEGVLDSEQSMMPSATQESEPKAAFAHSKAVRALMSPPSESNVKNLSRRMSSSNYPLWILFAVALTKLS